MSTWYIRVGVPSGEVHLYELGEGDDPIPLYEARQAEIYSELGIPEDWFGKPGWDVSLLEGPPHPSLLAVAIMHPLGT